MIRKTLPVTRAATFAVHLPNPRQENFPTPTGTGFFVSPEGWFLTAAHVITQNGASDGPVRDDLESAALMKEDDVADGQFKPGHSCIGLTFEAVDPVTDLALFKVDRDLNQDRKWLMDRDDFPYVSISSRSLEDGEEVYAFGYPLSQGGLIYPGPEVFVGEISLSPRVTSAIVSSTLEKTGTVMELGRPLHYVLDKALNYGNSGGPIVASSSGYVHAICSRFQPVYIPQPHLQRRDGYRPTIMIPSLYGVVVNLGHARATEFLAKHGIETVTEAA